MAYRQASYGDVYSSIDPYIRKPPTVRAAVYLAPTGLVCMVLAAFLAATTWVCTDECLRQAEQLSEELLECEERCKVTGATQKDEPEFCRSRCSKDVGVTLSKVRRREVRCKKGCAHSPTLMRMLAFVGAAALLAVVPLLGSYKGSCRCECCIGEGCSARLALFNVGYGFYAFSCMWVLPSVLEDHSEVGGKVLFSMAQCIACAAMAGSRHFHEKAEGNTHVDARAGPPGPRGVGGGGGGGGGAELGVMVGAPVGGPSSLELQQQVKELQHQVRDLVQLQTLQVQAATAAAASAAAQPQAAASPSVQQKACVGAN